MWWWRGAIPSHVISAGRPIPALIILPVTTDPVSRLLSMEDAFLSPILISIGRHQGETVPMLSMQ